MGVPRHEILLVSKLLAKKLVANEFAAYLDLKSLKDANAISFRAATIAQYGLCGFANLGSLGIQIGVLGALAPSRGKTIARIALSAMLCGFISTLQTATIVYVLHGLLHLNRCSRHLQGHVPLTPIRIYHFGAAWYHSFLSALLVNKHPFSIQHPSVTPSRLSASQPKVHQLTHADKK